MAAGLDLVIMTVSSAFGTSTTIPLGSAATVNGVTFLSFSAAGASAVSYDYSILDTGASEIGTATYRSSDNVLITRTPTKSTNAGAAITASSAALILCTMRAETAATFFNSINIQTFTSTGATYTATTGMGYGIAEAFGGGAGGGAVNGSSGGMVGAGGGGAGSYSRKFITSSFTGSTVVAGLGGAGGAAGFNPGSSGGDSLFGTALIARGGSGGGAASVSCGVGNGGAGGVAGTGDFTATGGSGVTGPYVVATTNLFLPSGAGANSPVGGGGPGRAANTAAINGNSATGYGAGGGGASCQNTTASASGGGGAPGIVVVTEFCRV